MDGRKETHQFKTEVQQMLNLIINSLYSNRDIFLRELISNASDAIDKLRFKAQTEPDILGDDNDFKIKSARRHQTDLRDYRQRDRHDLRRSHRKHRHHRQKRHRRLFWKPSSSQQRQETLTPELIGQFGVGFYSAFIVAEKVTLITRAAGEETRHVAGSRPATALTPWRRPRKKAGGRTIVLRAEKTGKGRARFYRRVDDPQTSSSGIPISSPIPSSWTWSTRNRFPRPSRSRTRTANRSARPRGG